VLHCIEAKGTLSEVRELITDVDQSARNNREPGASKRKKRDIATSCLDCKLQPEA